ncbi:MAG: hypothetical protein CFE28_10965 [Alphaproteobacteria bacterium PA2]|nr:MAG: hypothetical protein CFE28_10965 [Alphaproteobacteria bacterium PA2]
MPTITTTAVRAGDFVNSVGVNTHLLFAGYSYLVPGVALSAVKYLGVKNVRDTPFGSTDLSQNGFWATFARDADIKFDFVIPPGSDNDVKDILRQIKALISLGIVNLIEGSNEPNGDYGALVGATPATVTGYQGELYAIGKASGVPVINMSILPYSYTVYNYAGNLTAISDYANAHPYLINGQTPLEVMRPIIPAAQIAANRPVIFTEFGLQNYNLSSDLVDETVRAKTLLAGLLDAFQLGVVKTYIYELLDDHANSADREDNFGLFTADGTPKISARAIHNLLYLLNDKPSVLSPMSLSVDLSGLTADDHYQLFQNADGSYWLALWNEVRAYGPNSLTLTNVPAHNVSLRFGSALDVAVFDPLVGTQSISTTSKTTTVNIAVPDHPILVRIGSSLSTGDLTPAAQSLQAAALNVTRWADASFAAPLVSAVNNGTQSADAALHQILIRAQSATSVATLAYQFFTGSTPGAGGMDYLVSPTGPNANNLNSAYYQSFSLENRYINFAVNLGKAGAGQASFQAGYGSLSLGDALSKAYATIFGSTPSAGKIALLLNGMVPDGLGGTETRAQYFAFYGQDGLNGLGTKAAMVGWLLGEAVKADIGDYALSNDAFLTAIANGTTTYGVDLIGQYNKPSYHYISG